MVVQTNTHNLASFTTEDIMRHKHIAQKSLELEMKLIWSKKNNTQEIFKRKTNFILSTYPEIYKNDSLKIWELINKDIKEASDEEKNKSNLEIWLRKKMIERVREWRVFYAKEELKKLMYRRWYETISVDDFISKILSGEVILEKYVEYKAFWESIKIEDKKLIKNINSIKNNFSAIIKIINNDIKKHHYFITEHLSDISPLIDKIQNSLRILWKESDIINDNFKELKDELVKWLNIDEWTIKSCIFKITQAINTL